MDNNLDIVNARLPLLDETRLYSLSIRDGKWEKVEPQDDRIQAAGYESLDISRCVGSGKLDAEGNILLPGFIDSHMHLDKAFSLPKVGNVSGTLLEAISNYSKLAPSFTKEVLKERMFRTALQAAAFGTTAIRTHLDFNTSAGPRVALQTVEAALEVKQQLAPFVNLQLFPMLPYYTGSHEDKALMEEAMRMGVDGIGGAPHLADHPENGIDAVFELAAKYDCPIDLHTDETDNPQKRTVLYIAKKTMEFGFQGRVTVDHLCSLASIDSIEAHKVIERIAEAQLYAVTLPATNLYLQGRGDDKAVRRGVTRVKELTAAGVKIATASDNIHDPFHPFGRGDMLHIALITAYGTHMGAPTELRQLLRMMTEIPAGLMGLQGYGIAVGNAADFVLVDARTPEELFTMLPERRWIYRAGQWLKVAAPRTDWEVPALSEQWNALSHAAFGIH